MKFDDKKLKLATQLAKKKHRHIVRKDGRTPYWVHLVQVVKNLQALGIRDKYILGAGWLHDTIEDTDTDYEDLSRPFSKKVANIVAEVTKDKTLPEEERERKYIMNLSDASWQAKVIKLCDIWANLDDLDSGYEDESAKVEQVKKKLRYFDAIKSGLRQNSSRIPHLDEGIDQINEILSKYHRINPISLN